MKLDPGAGWRHGAIFHDIAFLEEHAQQWTTCFLSWVSFIHWQLGMIHLCHP